MYGFNDKLCLLDIPQVRFLIRKDGADAFAFLYAFLSECQRNGRPCVFSQYVRDVIASDLNTDADRLERVLNDCQELGLVSVSDGFLWFGNVSIGLLPDSEKNPESIETKRNGYPYADVIELWNETCPGLPKVLTVNQQRRTKMRQRFKEWSPRCNKDEILNFAKTIFNNVAASDFLNGKNNRNWCASFDWIFANDKNYLKVYEGNYNSKPKPNKFDDLADLCNALQ